MFNAVWFSLKDKTVTSQEGVECGAGNGRGKKEEGKEEWQKICKRN